MVYFIVDNETCSSTIVFAYYFHMLYQSNSFLEQHCVKSVQIRSFFRYIISRIRTEYGEIRSISPYLVRMRENTDQKKLRIWTFFAQCNFSFFYSDVSIYQLEFSFFLTLESSVIFYLTSKFLAVSCPFTDAVNGDYRELAQAHVMSWTT